MLIALWSAKGGSGTSVFTAACAVVLGRDAEQSRGVRVVDLAGDLPAIFGLGADPAVGLADWLAAGPEAPTDALDRLLVEVAPGIGLLPRGGGRAPGSASPRSRRRARRSRSPSGTASVPTLVDCGTAVRSGGPSGRRGRRRRRRRAARLLPRAPARGARLRTRVDDRRGPLEEAGRTLSANDVSEVLDLPVLARVPVKPVIARAVDAGVLAARLPDPLARSRRRPAAPPRSALRTANGAAA